MVVPVYLYILCPRCNSNKPLAVVFPVIQNYKQNFMLQNKEEIQNL